MEAVGSHFRDALGFIETSGAKFNGTFSSNLKRVAIVRPGYEGIAVGERKYGTSLQGYEESNPFLLACRLLWVARYIDLARDSSGGSTERARRDSCFDYVADFIDHFPEGSEWVEYWERRRLEDWAG